MRVQFRKVWLTKDTELPTKSWQTWPSDKKIVVKFTGVKQGEDDFTVSFVIDNVSSAMATGSDHKTYELHKTSAEGSVLYTFATALPRGYTYTVKEIGVKEGPVADNGYFVSYGIIDSDGRVAAGSRNVIINRDKFRQRRRDRGDGRDCPGHRDSKHGEQG